MKGGEKLRFKKSILIGMALFFAVSILAFSVVRVSAASTEKVATQEAQAKTDYFLAYPGLLPDHPLYSLKMVRDRIWLWLTNNSLKKAELLLLFADKRLGAAKALIEGNKVELGVSTMMKGEKYLERAISQGKMAAEKGEDAQVFLVKLSQATLKHQEVLTELVNKVPESFKESLGKAVSASQKSYEQIQEALKQ